MGFCLHQCPDPPTQCREPQCKCMAPATSFGKQHPVMLVEGAQGLHPSSSTMQALLPKMDTFLGVVCVTDLLLVLFCCCLSLRYMKGAYGSVWECFGHVTEMNSPLQRAWAFLHHLTTCKPTPRASPSPIGIPFLGVTLAKWPWAWSQLCCVLCTPWVLPVLNHKLANPLLVLLLLFGLSLALCCLDPLQDSHPMCHSMPGVDAAPCLCEEGTRGVQHLHLCSKHFLCICSCAYVSRRCLREHSVELK